MGHCPDCGAPSDAQDRFCGRCGGGLAGVAAIDTGLSRFCTGCGGSLQADARFCRRCGAGSPELKEDVFAGLPAGGNGNGAAAAQSLVSDLFQPRPAQASVDEAPTESIPRLRPPARFASAPEPPAGRRTGPPSTEAATGRVELARGTAQIGEILSGEPLGPERDTWETSIPRGAGFPWGGTLALVGALAVIMSAILDWGGPFGATLPRDIRASWLFEPGTRSGPTLGVVMLLAGSLGALVSLLVMTSPAFTFLRRFVGLVTVMIPVGFALRTLQAVASESSIFDLPSALGAGVIVAAGGATLQLVAPRPRRT